MAHCALGKREGKVNQTRILLFAVLALLAPARLHATDLEICNDTQFQVAFAIAAKNGFLSSGSWDVKGWYSLPPGKCIEGDRWGWDGRPVHVAFQFTDSTGTSGAPVFEFPNSSQGVSLSKEHFCVKDGPFEYTLPGDFNSYLLGKSELPSRSCRDGEYSFPASIYDWPPDEDCDSFGNCFGFAHFHLKLKTDRAIPVGPQGSSQTSSNADPKPAPGAIPKPFAKGTRNAVLLGKNLVSWNSDPEQKWYSENGTLVLETYESGTSFFDVRPRAGVEHHQSADSWLLQEWKNIQQELEGTNTHFDVLTNAALGRACFEYSGRTKCANYAAIDFDKSRKSVITGGGITYIELDCREDTVCVIQASGSDDGSDKSSPTMGWLFTYQPLSIIPQTAGSIPVASEESGMRVLAMLAEIARLDEKYFEPIPVVVK